VRTPRRFARITRLDDGQRLVQPDRLASAEFDDLHRRGHRDPHPPSSGEHVHSSVGVTGQENAVAAGRLGKPVNLLTQRHQLAARFTQRFGELLVAGAQLR